MSEREGLSEDRLQMDDSDSLQTQRATAKTKLLSKGKSKSEPSQSQVIELNAHFSSFMSLRSALDKYQKENHVQLIVKDSKLLSSESTKRVIPKVHHLVNPKLMYHSITYICKYHGELKQKPGSRVKNIGSKRLSCPMYMRFKLSTDLQSLVLFDIMETHNHSTDFNTYQLSPRQQIYRLSLIKRGKPDPCDIKKECKDFEAQKSVENEQTDELDNDYSPPKKAARLSKHKDAKSLDKSQSRSKDSMETSSGNGEEEVEDDNVDGEILYKDNPYSPLDPESSCSDSDEEEFRKHRDILPLPIRLIGSAVQCSPELISLTKELITTQLEALNAKKKKILLENKMLELQNAKLALELKHLEKEKNHSDQSTTFYLQS